MKPDYYAFLGEKEYPNGFAGIDYCDVDAVTARYHQLVATGHKDDRNSGANELRSQWAKQRLNVDLEPLPDLLKQSDISLAHLPLGAFYIQFEFCLLKPYLSRDDNQFYIVDNPIVREKVFRYPMVRATAWKGSLRHALWQLGHETKDEQIRRLFGTANDEKPEEGNDGRLYFYPTFFTRTSLEIINPHDRKRRVGKNPIFIESVPADTAGTFTLLYAPVDRGGQSKAETFRQIAADLQQIAQGLGALFTTYGFGAKTSSGFGLAANAVDDGVIVVGGLEYQPEATPPDAAASAPAQPDLPRYLAAPDQLHPDFVSAAGGLVSEADYQRLIEGRGHKYAKKDKQLYGKAKSWWEREGQQLAQPLTAAVEPEPPPQQPAPYPLARETFATFDKLSTKAQTLAAALEQMGGVV